MRLLWVLALALTAQSGATELESIVADSGMLQPPHVMIEGWNMCNRASDSGTPNCTIAPRWADCASPDGAGKGPNGNLVTPQANEAGLAAGVDVEACDAYSEAKERNLSSTCRYGSQQSGNASFWTGMLKSGNFQYSMMGVTCGLWCKEDSCVEYSKRFHYNNLDMNQPFVQHAWSEQQADGSYSGAFWGTWDAASAPAPAPDRFRQLQHQRHGDASSVPCNLTGTWIGGDKQHPVTVTMLANGSFQATAEPWKVTRTGVEAADGSVTMYDNDGTGTIEHGHVGTINASAPACSAVLWDGEPSWCRVAAPCDLTGMWIGSDKQHPVTVTMLANGSFQATAEPWKVTRTGVEAADGSVTMYDNDGTGRVNHGHVGTINASAPACSAVLWDGEPSWCRAEVCGAPAAEPSYFALEWSKRADEAGYVYRSTLKTSAAYPWLMLYTGADAAQGWKGGYPWPGSGMLLRNPVSSLNNASLSFRVRFWLNISSFDSSSSFYFLNTGSCWKVDGQQCDYDVTTDVTRYILMDLNAKPQVVNGREVRCGRDAASLVYCPRWHRNADGTMVRRGSPHFPYDAYVYASPTPLEEADLVASTNTISSVSAGLGESPLLWRFDNMSNPQAQDFLKIAPSAEWAQYGFPASREQAMQPRYWDLDAGRLTGATAMVGTEPSERRWATFNVGPEMGLGGGAAALNVWELADFDVLAPAL